MCGSVLDVHDNAMVGSVPSAVWTLSALEYLDWSGNAVNSNFPSGATSLNLTYVQTASVPRLACSDCWYRVGDCDRWLSLANASLTGTFPVEVTAMSSLTGLSLSGNALTGTIPEAISSLTALR